MAIVNEAFIGKLTPGENPVGKRVRLGKDRWQRIAGVIGDTRYQGPAQPAGAEIYFPFAQDAGLEFVAIRTAVHEEGVLGAVRNIIRRLDPGLPITQVRTMRQPVDLATALPRAMMALVVGFAAIALGMATLGLAGVMAYAVSRRGAKSGCAWLWAPAAATSRERSSAAPPGSFSQAP